MFTLVIGGAASGKSELAEELVLQGGGAPRVYIATMQVWDDECKARVKKHRAMRSRKGFETVEAPLGLAAQAAQVPRGSTVLLECLTNLTANELFDPAGAGADTEQAVLAGVEALLQRCGDLVVVSGDLCSGGAEYLGDTDRYLRLLARLNILLAKRADNVCEAVCGRLCWHKKKE